MLKRIIAVVMCMVVAFSLTSCGGNNIASVNGENIHKGYFEYYFNQLKYQLESELGEESWETAQYEGKSALEYAKERALQSAIEDNIITDKASEDGIKLSGNDIKAMGQLKNQWISYYGSKDKFFAELESYGINENQFDYMMKAAYLKSHLVDKYTEADDEEVLTYYNDDIVKVKHILIFTINPETGAALGDDELEAASQQANHLHDLAKRGADFDALVAEYTDDQNVFYYLGEGFSLADNGTESTGMVPEFETASMSLGVGEVSDIVESTYGYHIIKRYENDTEMFEKAKETLTTKVKTEKFSDVLNDWKSGMKIVVNESLYNSYK